MVAQLLNKLCAGCALGPGKSPEAQNAGWTAGTHARTASAGTPTPTPDVDTWQWVPVKVLASQQECVVELEAALAESRREVARLQDS